jgi:hypothetical protein
VTPSLTYAEANTVIAAIYDSVSLVLRTRTIYNSLIELLPYFYRSRSILSWHSTALQSVHYFHCTLHPPPWLRLWHNLLLYVLCKQRKGLSRMWLTGCQLQMSTELESVFPIIAKRKTHKKGEASPFERSQVIVAFLLPAYISWCMILSDTSVNLFLGIYWINLIIFS